MSTTAEIFEIVPFQHEVRGRFAGGARRLPRSRGPASKPWPSFRKRRILRTPWIYRVRGGYLSDSALEPQAEPIPSSTASSEYVRWLQSTLNRATGGTLPIDGVMSAAVRAAIRDFQRKNRLPVSGYIGPDTDAALRRVDGGSEIGALELELSPEASVADSALGWTLAKPIGVALKRLRDAEAVAGKPVPGLYRFFAQDRRFYTGMAEKDLRTRILQHLWCLSHLGISRKNFCLALYLMPGKTCEQILGIEKAIIKHHKNKNPQLVLNVRTELEFLELSNL